MKYEAVIFDLDGTLIDTLKDLALSVNYALEQFEMPVHEIDDYRMMVGDGIVKLIERALPDDRMDMINEVMASQVEYYKEHLFDNTALYPGIENMLKELKASGVKLAVLSNKQQERTREMVRRFFSSDIFDYVAGANDDIPLKPEPTPALFVANQMSVEAEKVVFVGDTSIDMQTAVNATMLPVGVQWGFRDDKELYEHGCSIILNSPDELISLINGQDQD